MAKPNSQRVERRKISALRSHPLQERYYDALPPHKLAELAADIARNGLRDRPHVLPRNRASLPPNTIDCSGA